MVLCYSDHLVSILNQNISNTLTSKLSTILSQGYSFVLMWRAPTQQTQKAPHHRPLTPSTENSNPKNPNPKQP